MTLQWLVTSLALLSLGIDASKWRGIAPELQRQLTAVSSFTCDKGEQRLDLSRLNDNYCDCDDGSDEPGTAACSHTRAVFHCVNAGFFSLDIPTSRVNDGVCDCCDASDEYASGASCASRCFEEMQHFKADKKDLIEQAEAGLKDRVALVAEAQKLWHETEQKKHELEASVASLQVMVEQMEARKAEEEKREQEEKQRQIVATKHEMGRQLGLSELTKEQLVSIILEIGRTGVSFSAKHELLPIIRNERQAAYPGEEKDVPKTRMEELDEAFRERDDARQQETRRIEQLIKERQKAKENEEKAGAMDEGVEIGLEMDDEDPVSTQDGDDGEESLTLPDVETHPLDLLYDEMAASEKYERSEAIQARKQLEETTKDLKTTHEALTDVKTVLEKSYGKDRVLFGLRDKCVEAEAGQYTYKVCFFGTAMQDHIKLGDMEELKEGNNGDEMITFSNGQKCWNGPHRSMTVKLECGPEPMKLYEIEEPSTCVYAAKLRTPAVCHENDRERILTFENAQTAPHHIEMEVPPTL